MSMEIEFMIVNRLKVILSDIGLCQEQLANLLTEYSGKYYNQSMVSKRLKCDEDISMLEIRLIVDIMNDYIRANNIKKVKKISLDKIIGGNC